MPDLLLKLAASFSSAPVVIWKSVRSRASCSSQYSLLDSSVDDMEDYGQMFRAVAFFSFKYGKIDWLESNNEYWLEQDARLRTDSSFLLAAQRSVGSRQL